MPSTDPNISGVALVLPLGVEIATRTGETIFEAAVRQGLSWPTRCFGQAQCTLCALEVIEGEDSTIAPDIEERSVVQRVQMMRGGGRYRLACRLKIEGRVTVRKDGVAKVSA